MIRRLRRARQAYRLAAPRAWRHPGQVLRYWRWLARWEAEIARMNTDEAGT